VLGHLCSKWGVLLRALGSELRPGAGLSDSFREDDALLELRC
jgi:hypothetical protein